MSASSQSPGPTHQYRGTSSSRLPSRIFLLQHAGLFLPYFKLSLCNFISLQIWQVILPLSCSKKHHKFFPLIELLTYSFLWANSSAVFNALTVIAILEKFSAVHQTTGCSNLLQPIKEFDGQRTERNPPSSASDASGPLQSKSFSVPVQLNTSTDKPEGRKFPRIMVQQPPKPILIYQVRTALHSLNPSLTNLTKRSFTNISVHVEHVNGNQQYRGSEHTKVGLKTRGSCNAAFSPLYQFLLSLGGGRTRRQMTSFLFEVALQV